jgi:hypothetical protein
MKQLSMTIPLLLTLAALMVPVSAEPLPREVTPLDQNRINAVAAMLPDKPNGPGRPITDRTAWDALAALPRYQDLIKRAEAILAKPLPVQTDDLYLEFSRTGNRTHWQDVAFARRNRLGPLVLAECAENKGRFLPAIEQFVDEVCAERTWVLPAADEKLKNFNGEITEIDLISSLLGWDLGTADYLLGDRLKPATREKLRVNIKRRVLDPFLLMVRGESKPVYLHGNKTPSRTMFWLMGSNNWNAVCLAGVTGAALTELSSREERAEFIVAAEKYSRYFLAGFTTDGNCSEGLGYWNYGFGRYVLLSETIRQATAGGVDLLTVPGARMPATYPARIQIVSGISPAFADCGVFATPTPVTMYVLNRRLNLGLTQYGPETTKQVFPTTFETMLYEFDAPSSSGGNTTPAAGPGLRDWFDQAMVYVGRPAPGSTNRFGVAFKGGHNAETHNHNDLGSFVVVSGDRPVLVDPGSEVYTARTFSPRRYESNLLNSFGHSTPVVAGVLQSQGRQAEAHVIRTDFSPDTDTLELDLKAAYAVPDLQSLRRTFVYSRKGTGAFTVTDRVEMKTPQTFGTALITLGSWIRQSDGSLLVCDGDSAVRVEIDAGGQEFTVQSEQIKEDSSVTPTRIGINLKSPLTNAVITMKITPQAPPVAVNGNLLFNGDFEKGAWGWILTKGSLGSISTEKAASGNVSLKITDASTGLGSNISSGYLAATGGKKYVLRGKAFHTSGKGVAVYVRYLNAERKIINPTDTANNILALGVLKDTANAWEPFAYPFQTPPGTTSLQLWIHSGNGASVEAYLDDLEIVPESD